MEKMKKLIWIIVAIAIIAGAVFLFGRGNGDISNSEPIKIGVLLCLTGDCAEWGENSLNGLKLASEEINNNGGVLGRPVELVIQDSAEDNPADSVSAYRQLVLQKVKYIIGPNWTKGGFLLLQ